MRALPCEPAYPKETADTKLCFADRKQKLTDFLGECVLWFSFLFNPRDLTMDVCQYSIQIQNHIRYLSFIKVNGYECKYGLGRGPVWWTDRYIKSGEKEIETHYLPEKYRKFKMLRISSLAAIKEHRFLRNLRRMHTAGVAT